MLSHGYFSVCWLLAHRGIPHPFIFPFLPPIPILGRIYVLLIVEGKKHGKAGSSICFHRFLELSLKLRIAGLRKKEIANSKAWFPAFSLEISAMAAPPNLCPLFQTRWCSGLSFLLITSTRGYVGEDGGEKYNWERYAERFTKHL
ncbi:hypothetical protein ACFX14_022352 [Malus domestica]